MGKRTTKGECGKVTDADGATCQLPAGHDEPQGLGQACCPGPECWACTGEACWKCGAGCYGTTDPGPCEHDVLQRHEEARETPEGTRP